MTGKKRLAILTSHPIQYNAPLFRTLSDRGVLDIMVFYTWGKQALENKYDPGFGKVISWDIPLLQGYPSQFLLNSSKEPGSHHFKGIVNPDIIGQIDAWRPDALLIYGWNFTSHLKVIRHYKNKIPVFFRGDSTLLNDRPGFKATLRKIFLKWVYRHVDKAFYVGQHNKDYFLNAGLKESQLVYAPHAVDNAFFQDDNEDKEQEAMQWRHELNIPDSATVFLFAGKLEHNKLPFTLLDVFNEDGFPTEVHLVIVGNGNLESGMKEKANSNRIHFVDFQNQKRMPVVYRLADVFILPSGSETWGLAMNESMASGRSVIASTRCGGGPDLIKEGYNGYIFRAGDAGNLKEKVLLMLKDKSTVKDMGRNALSHIHDFSLSRIAKELEKAVAG
jgi:glycosyltransferase involved in cell wall biosynthesis